MPVTLGATATLAWSPGGGIGAATVAVQLPDGTTATPPTVTGSGGAYTAPIVTTQPGRHVLTWTRGTERYADILDVWPADPRYILSIDDALAVVGSGPASQRDDVALFSAAATYVIESLAGPVLVAAKTYRANGGRASIVLPYMPATVSAVTVSGALLATSAYVVDGNAGIVYGPFAAGAARNVEITYTVGAATVPPHLRLAAQDLIRHLWSSSRRGGAPSSRNAPADMVATPYGFAVPKRVAELCAVALQAPGFA